MHQISIPQSVIDGIIRQRGRLYRYERIAGPSAALVVVDLQNVFMLPGMPVEVPAAREIVPNVNRLAEAMRAAGGKVVWIKMTLAGETESWSVFFDGDPRRSALDEMTPGAHGHALYSELDVRPADSIVEKTRFSAFIQGSSELDRLLRGLGIDTIVVAGTLTNVCCESTARDAMMLNYKIVFVSDANAALSDEEHNATLTTVARVFGDVRATEEVIACLTRDSVPSTIAEAGE